jgi:serum/glucocorticoid-regulated kinase 2
LKLIYPEVFQLSYINLLNAPSKSQNNKITVLFVADPLKLRVKLEDYNKSVILAYGSITKIFLLYNKSEKQ